MPTFGNSDDANSAPKWGLNQLKLAPTQENMDVIYGNTSGPHEILAANTEEAITFNNGSGPGWILVTRGSGQRAGRVHMEQLVAGLEIINNHNEPVSVAGTLLLVL